MNKLNTYYRVGVLVLIAAFVLTASLAVAEKGEASEVPSPDSPEFARYVLDQVDDVYRGQSSQGTMEMNVKTKHWSRSMRFESWSLGKDYSLVRILKPKKEKGTATLKAKEDLYIYLNKTGKTVKITAGMMGGSWMGSHFTNDDLVRESRMADDYTIVIDPVRELDGVKVWKFVLTPKPDAPVVWGKIETVVRQNDLMPLWQIFYDEDGEKSRELRFSDFRTISGRLMPAKMVMRPLDGSGEFTEVTVRDIDFKVKLDKNYFSIKRLRSL